MSLGCSHQLLTPSQASPTSFLPGTPPTAGKLLSRSCPDAGEVQHYPIPTDQRSKESTRGLLGPPSSRPRLPWALLLSAADRILEGPQDPEWPTCVVVNYLTIASELWQFNWSTCCQGPPPSGWLWPTRCPHPPPSTNSEPGPHLHQPQPKRTSKSLQRLHNSSISPFPDTGTECPSHNGGLAAQSFALPPAASPGSMCVHSSGWWLSTKRKC